ncbi:hypothetical protein I553_3912, partial [Mycobacterium xenopi 4042]
MSRVGEPLRAVERARRWRRRRLALLAAAIRAPFWLISDATLLWWPVHRRPSVTENRLKAGTSGGPRRRTRPLRRHCRPCAPRPHPAAGRSWFPGRCLLVKAVDGNDFHVSTRQEAGMVR